MIEDIYQMQLYEHTVKCNKYAELNKDLLTTEMEAHQKKMDELYNKSKQSYQFKKMPDHMLPKLDEGNYSLLLYDKNLKDVMDWVKQDLRTLDTAVNTIKADIPKFEQFDTFNTQALD